MVYNECNLWAGIYKVQTFGTTQIPIRLIKLMDLKMDQKSYETN